MTLIEILKNETVGLKDQYVEMTAKWARSEFTNLRKWAADYHAGKFGYGEASKKYYRLPYEITNPNGKVEDYVAKQVKSAIDHYEDSIVKLAARINAKGLDIGKIKATTSHIGVNINTTLTDGFKTVRAFTIIAGGAVQRPHYRYLIK
jgi:hypothetical protein